MGDLVIGVTVAAVWRIEEAQAPAYYYSIATPEVATYCLLAFLDGCCAVFLLPLVMLWYAHQLRGLRVKHLHTLDPPSLAHQPVSKPFPTLALEARMTHIQR